MKNYVIQISMADADAFAMEYFNRIGGLNREGEKYRRMLKQGMEIKERIKDKLDLKAVISFFQGNVISGNTAELDGVKFECNAFQRLNPAHVKGIYAYILTAGTLELGDEEPILDQLYADIWGTAYIDAGLEVLKKYIKRFSLNSDDPAGQTEPKAKLSLLDSFGPGFYGMGVDQVSKFFELLNGEAIGVVARSSSLMLPLKSCAGFFVVVDDDTELPASDCKSCRAEYKNCAFCQAVIKTNIDEDRTILEESK